MLRVLGSPKRLCDGSTRRDMLRAGGLGLLGLRWPISCASPKPRPRRTSAHAGFGKAKACILLYLYGSPSQLETFDMKPDAPVEIRGELKPIRSTPARACDVCELLPNAARVMDHVTVVRSLTHPYPIHGVAYATTGVPQIDVPMELNPRDGRHWPFIGSVVDYLDPQGRREARRPRADQHRPAVAVQQPARRRGGPRRPLRGLPRQRLQPALDRVPRQGDDARGQDAAGPEIRRRRAVHGHHARGPLRAGRRHRAARRPDARPARPQRSRWSTSSTTPAATSTPPTAGQALRPLSARWPTS